MASGSNWDSIAIGVIAVFVGFVALAFTQSVFNLFFVAIVVAVLWNDSTKLSDLQKRLSALEGKTPTTTPASS